ncbi:MAG: SdiA-regulated domain-containing protein [Pseudomonadota bacterium]
MRSLVLPLLVFLACTPAPQDTGDTSPPAPDSAADTGEPVPDTGDSGADTSPPVTDADGDGYDAEAHGGDDCDDTDPAVNPGATETFYDGVDADCSGGSDYDADGDGADAEAWGGTDCDDADPAVQEGCEQQDSPLQDYILATEADTVPEITTNLSGIAWNPITQTFMAVLDSSRILVELDADMATLRVIALSNVDYRDTEDIAYLGQDAEDNPTYALVTEDGVVYLGAVPDDGATSLDLAAWQVLTYAADDMGNSGGEGIAYDATTRTFWVCKERSPMEVYTFERPATDADASYEDGSLAVSVAFDAETLLAEHAGDLASCLFDPRTGRLLILSEQSDAVLDVDPDGAVHGVLDITDTGLSKPEGITLTDRGDLLIVGEPNQWARYAYEGD